jgi:LuxR family maltose regulon positive regulatory protein
MVEDDENFLKACKVLLEAEGYEVKTAADIKSARKLYSSYAPDVIILDVMLPDGSGLDLCREIRAALDVPVLFMTALDESSDVVAGLGAGGDIYITKPVEFPVLKAHVEAALRRVSGIPASGSRTSKIKRTQQEQYVFPELLERKLAKIQNYPLTLVEAPSGFGKTTAVREYFRNNLPEGAREKWHTCLGEPTSDAWAGICRLFGDSTRVGEMEGDISWRLSKLFPPTNDSLPDIASAMRECRCDTETFLVIDNYQLFENEASHDIVNAFSVHSAEKLRIIVITQPLRGHDKNVHNANIHRIEAGDFLFDRGSTARFCRWSGAKLSDKELENVQNFSEGWVAAIRLYIENYRKTGSFSSAGNMEELIETAIWNKISDEQRNFLMALSLLDGFTEKQAAVMDDKQTLAKSIVHLLENNFFIPYVADKGVYSMHSLLRDYLLKRFDAQAVDFVETMNRRAGSACEAVSDYFQAARFYMKIKEFDAILSMPFTPRYLNELEEKDVVGFLERFVEECPENTLRKRPFTLLAFAFQFMKGGKREFFSRMIRLLNDICQSGVLPETELSRVKGELTLLMSFTVFNDIEKMSEYHKKALSYLNSGGESSSSVILGRTPWTFGITSVFSLFWSSVGQLDNSLLAMDECLPIYSNLANGHGAGADSVFRAEAYLMRGDDAEAEAACHKAIHQANEAQQMSICLCAELVLARIAILRGDGNAYAERRDRITKNAEEPRQRAVSRMGELCLTVLDVTLGNVRDLPEWLRDADAIRRIFYPQGHSYVFMLHCMMLLLEGRHAELYGLTDPLLNLARGMHYLMPQVYQNIYMAVAKKKDGALDQASEYLCAALDIALPDRIYLPFAHFGAVLLPLMETVSTGIHGKNFDSEKMAALKALCRRQMAGLEPASKQKKSILTPREKDIALLAKERLSTREIAMRLFISENTVSSALKNIYSKLEIHSKTELAKVKF